LASDLGDKIGGAHLKELRRTRAGPFSIGQAHTLDEVKNAAENNSLPRQIILPVEKAVAHLTRVVANDSVIPDILNGAPLRASDICKIFKDFSEGELVAITSTNGELLALGRVSKKTIRIERVVKA
jgi:tRNA pseudouridine55 synthase